MAVVSGGAPVSGAGNWPISQIAVSVRTALQALSLASTRRVDLVMLGDSNQAYNGYGFSTGLEKALSARFQIYATGQLNRSSPAGFSGASSYSDSQFSSTGVSPVQLGDIYQPYANPDSAGYGVKVQYGWVSSGTTVSGGNILGAILPASAMNISAALRGWFAWGASNAMGGQFQPSARLEYSPYSQLGSASSAQSNSDTQTSLRMSYLDIPAASRTGSISMRWMAPNAGAANAIVGPWVGYFVRVEDTSRTAGVSCHTLYGSGGQSLWNYAYELQATSDASLTTFFAETRRLQISAGQSPIVVVYANSGLNDRNNVRTPSRGPARLFGSGSSTQEYVDNLRGIQRRVFDIWQKQGWSLDELYWLIVPSHRISDPEDTQLAAYRTAIAAATASDPHTSVVDLGGLMTYAGANTAGWYAAGQSQFHLTNAGYDGVSALVVNQIP